MLKIKAAVLSLILGVILVTPLNIYSDGFTKTTLSAYASFIPAKDPELKHDEIKTVLNYLNVFNAKANLDYGPEYRLPEGMPVLYYYYGEDSSNISTVKGIKNGETNDYYFEINPVESAEKINYRIQVDFLVYGQPDPDKTIYFPVPDNPGDIKWQKTDITSKVTEDVDGSAGGTITVQTGNQAREDTKVEIPSGAYNGTYPVTIDFGYNSGSNVLKAPAYNETSSRKDVCIADWSISPELADVELLIPIRITNGYLEYTRPETTKKDVLQYKRDESDTWHNVEKNGNLLIDIENKMFSCEMPKFGYYRIMAQMILEDNDYRPKRRALIKNRMRNRSDMFEFNNLQEGDVVKIFNVNGKKIREIRSGDADGFVWDGRTDSGEWAKSGIYIYQIKVEGKLISGTIVFAK